MTLTLDVENRFLKNYFEFQQMEYGLTFKLLLKNKTDIAFTFQYNINTYEFVDLISLFKLNKLYITFWQEVFKLLSGSLLISHYA
jgi:hypothetical protein